MPVAQYAGATCCSVSFLPLLDWISTNVGGSAALQDIISVWFFPTATYDVSLVQLHQQSSDDASYVLANCTHEVIILRGYF